MRTTILSLPNEILLAIAASLPELADLTALSLVCRRLWSIAVPELYARIPRDFRATRQALFYLVENGLLEPVRLLLAHGVNSDAVYCSPVPRDCLLRVLAAQGRRAGRRPLIDPKFALEYLGVTLRDTHPGSQLVTSYRRLLSSPLVDPDGYLGSDDESSYNFLIHELHAIVTQYDAVWSAAAGKLTTGADSDPSAALESLYHWTALHVAAHRGDDALVRLLLESGAAIDALLVADEKPASQAISKGIDTRPWAPPLPQTPLHAAISAGHTSTARLLLASGASVTVSPGNLTALHVAAWHGDLDLCELLVGWKPDLVDVRTDAQLTPFHYAVAAGHLGTVGRFLLDKGADLHARFDGSALGGNTLFDWNCSALTHALLTRRYQDALLLIEMGAEVGPPDMRPFEACLYPSDISARDEDQMLPILRHLASRASQVDPTCERSLALYLRLAAEKHLPQALRLLLEIAQHRSLPVPSMSSLLETASRNVASSAAVETIILLIDHGVAAQGMQMPCLGSWFSRGFPRPFGGLIRVPEHVNLQLTKEAVLDARLAVGKLLYERIAATPGGVDDVDLRTAVMGACQPGGLPVCEWLASVGALRLVDKRDLSIMLFRTALSQALGGNDPALARWVLDQADRKGHKAHMLHDWDVPRMISRSGGLAVAQVVLSHGASPDFPPDGPRRRMPLEKRVLVSCHTRQRLELRRFHLSLANHVVLMACARPDMAGAAELLRLSMGAAGQAASELVNSALIVPPNDKVYTPASLVCCTNLPGRDPAGAPSEPARLAMLKLLLEAGAEVHTLAELNCATGMDPNTQNLDQAGPDEALWRALASEDEREVGRQQEASTGPCRPSRWSVFKWHKPILCAIGAQLPTLVEAMLEARPLAEPNSPVALSYLRAVCGGHHRLCPRILEIVLDMADIDDADVPLNADGETALMVLMGFAKEEDFSEGGPALIHPECRCEPDLIGFEKDDLCNMVRLLLSRGAKWNTRSPATGCSALDLLREVLRDGMTRKSMYKCHNLAELRKHLVLDVFADGVDRVPDFNPFEMGVVRATRGGR